MKKIRLRRHTPFDASGAGFRSVTKQTNYNTNASPMKGNAMPAEYVVVPQSIHHTETV